MPYSTELSEALAQCLEAQAEDHGPEDAAMLRVIDLHIDQLTDRLIEMGTCAAEARTAIRRAMRG
jgi:hypothetical protein